MSSMTRIAWPELNFSLAEPLIVAEGYRLYCVMTDGPCDRSTRATVPSGTIAPPLVRM